MTYDRQCYCLRMNKRHVSDSSITFSPQGEKWGVSFECKKGLFVLVWNDKNEPEMKKL